MTLRQIFGRDAELARVGSFLDGIGGEPGALLVEGEAGIGKTTVWAAAIEAAQSRRFQVLQARAAEGEVRLSHAALADLVGHAFEETRDALPAVQRRALAAALLRAETDEPAQPRTIATALVGVLASLAEVAVVVVAIDDVQWLDPASAGALAFAARRLPARVGLVITRRGDPADAVPLGLERALPEGRLERLVPRPLSLGALHHLIRDRLGSAPPRPALARLADASGGNPFLALEIARALAPDWTALAGGGPLPVPRDLEGISRERVAGLSAGARLATLAAAALSQPTRQLIVAAAAPPSDAGDDLVEAEEAGILVVETEKVRFTHPLLASAIYGTATPERRRRLHERLADVVADPEERARHLALATTEPDEAVAAELEQAAAQAARRGAQQAAAELFGGACRLTPAERAGDVARRKLAHAAALLALGDVGGARARAEEVAQSAPGLLRARALLLLGDVAWIGGGGGAIEQLELALDAAAGDAELVAAVYPKLVNVSVALDPGGTSARARDAAKALDPERDPAGLASVYLDWAWGETLRGNGEQRELLRRWRAFEEQAGPDARKSLFALIYFWCVDDSDAARQRFALEERWYRERGEDVWRAERMVHIGLAELRAGRWDVAERYVEDGCEALAQLDAPGPWAAVFRIRAIVDAHRGRIERARDTLLPLVAQAEGANRPWWEALLLSALGFVEHADGNHGEADRVLSRMQTLAGSLGVREFLPDRSEPFHVESLVALGEAERARDVLDRLEKRATTFPRPWTAVGLPRARAIVYSSEGDVTSALAALDELDSDAAAKLPFDHARALLVQGRLQRRAKQKRAAAETLRQALVIFEQLGAPRWEAQARSELDRVGLRRSQEDLTSTERRVAELAAEGLTNREVAARAFMSPKTVQANLTRVYRKLGISSRAELGARIAEERGGIAAQK